MFFNLRNDFPVFQYHPKLIFLDNASTTHKPKCVIDRLVHFYSHEYASAYRGDYPMSRQVSELYNDSRVIIQNFIQAKYPEEIVFTYGTTHGINILAQGLSNWFQDDDEIIISEWEHSSNILPWQMLSKVKIQYIKDWNELQRKISPRTKLIVCNHVSHSVGYTSPMSDIIQTIKRIKKDVKLLIDGTQSINHLPTNVQTLECDFFVFSSHKLYAPNGSGVLYVKKNSQDCMSYAHVGGGQVTGVKANRELAILEDFPEKYEPGTLNAPAVIGMAEAIKYLITLGGMQVIEKYLAKLSIDARNYIISKLGQEVEILYGQGPIIAITFKNKSISVYDASCMLGGLNICVKSGYVCNHLKLERIGHILRVSLGIYNNMSDIDRLCKELLRIIRILS